VHAVFERLQADGRATLMPRVGRALARIYERESNKRDLVLTVARESDIAKAKKEAKDVISAFMGESGTADLKTQVDDSLIGGWRLEGNERLVDASFKKQLLDVYQGVTSA
jgi:F0F1-type ATP synthase delta subunit